MIDWHYGKLEKRLVQVQRRLEEALSVANDPTKPIDRRLGYARSAIEGAMHDIGFTLELHGNWVEDNQPHEDFSDRLGLFVEPSDGQKRVLDHMLHLLERRGVE